MIIALAALATPLAATTPQQVDETIIVRAERLVENPSNSQTLTSDVLANQAGARLDEALRIVPGVGLFRRTSSGAANATIGGLSLRPIAPNGAGRALVSLDGVPQNDPFGGWIYWSRYDRIFLDTVEVKRGGAGAGFGPMALTGTLDLTEARGRPARFSASTGAQNTNHFAGRQSLSTQNASFTAMGAYESSDGTIPVSKSQRGLADRAVDFEALSVSLVTDIERNNGAWSFRGSGFSDAKGAGLIGGQSATYGLDVSAARRFEGAWGQSRALIYAQGRAFSNQTVAVTAGRVGTTPALDQYATPSSALGGALEFLPPPTKLFPKLIVDGRRAQGETRELFRYIGRDFTRTRIAGGAQDLLGVGVFFPRPLAFDAMGLVADGGLRLDYWANYNGLRFETDRATGVPTLNERAQNKSGTVVTGRLSFAQRGGPFALTFYRTFRPPTLNELHRPFRVGNDVTEANAALVPETLSGLDVDVRVSRDVAGGKLETSLSLYANQLNDPIGNVTRGIGPGVLPRVGFLPAGGSLRERTNVGRVDATGLEARISWQGEPNGSGWLLSGTVTDARVSGGDILPQLTGKRPAQAPIWSGVARVDWPISSSVKLSVTARGEGARFEDDLNSRKLAAYGALDLYAAWQFNDIIAMTLSGENVLDTAIVAVLAGDGVVSQAQRRMLRIGFTVGR